MNKIIRLYITIISLFLFLHSGKIIGKECKTTIQVIPKYIPAESEIYIVGNHTKLGNWDTNDIKLENEPDSIWTKTFSFDSGTHLEYKITRGSWLNEAVDSNGIELPNFMLNVEKDTTVTIHVFNWRDTFKGPTVLSLERLQHKDGIIELFENWKYKVGDDSNYANPSFDDRDWKTIDPRLPENEYRDINWKGIGWFRIHLKVDRSIWGVPLSLRVRQAGASEIYLNGRLLYSFGKVGSYKDTEVVLDERNPKFILFDSQVEQIIAVRYSNFSADYIIDLAGNPGFDVFLEDLNQHVEDRVNEIRITSVYQMIFTVIPIVLAFLHLLLFLFNLRAKENLYYAICMIGFSVLSYANFQIPFTENVFQVIYYNNLVFISVNIAILFGLLTSYSRAYEKIPKQFYVFLFIMLTLITIILIHPIIYMFIYFNIFIVIVAVEMIRVIFKPGTKRQDWTWLIGLGFILLFLSVIYQLLIDTDLVEPVWGNRIVYVYGILALSIALSINLARDFSKLNEKIVQQAREAKEQEINTRILEADNIRKTKELEEARELQLSLLPKSVPELPHLDIAVFMKTATEVGGDYYDFQVSNNRTLTVAIGDATGHGMKAGNMVISIKSLFSDMPVDMSIPDFFNKCTDIIKRMNMKQLYMGLTIMRVQDQRIVISSAGMPPAYIYRVGSNEIEEITLKGMPIGAANNFEYQQVEKELSAGDTILLMSDGFPELFNESNEILDYQKTVVYFKEVAHKSPNEIIEHLKTVADQWRGKRKINDDMTFVVLKFRKS